MIKYIIVFVIGVILGVLLLDRKELIKWNKYEVISVKTDTSYITKEVVKQKEGKDIYHDTTIYVELPQIVDTMAILNNYFAKNVYKDTLKLDSLGYIALTDTISENYIKHRYFYANIKEKIINTEKIVKEREKGHIYLGLGTNGVGLLYTTKNKLAMSAHFSQKSVNFSAYYRIK